MPNVASHARTICPYFRREKGNAIVCEGPDNRCRLVMVFTFTGDRMTWQCEKCEQYDYAQRCMVAAALDKKYEKEADAGEAGTA